MTVTPVPTTLLALPELGGTTAFVLMPGQDPLAIQVGYKNSYMPNDTKVLSHEEQLNNMK